MEPTSPLHASFDDQLVLFRYFLQELKLDSLSVLSQTLNHAEYEGVNESGNTHFCDYLVHICNVKGAAIPREKLLFYDENINRHTRQVGQKRGGLRWKYFQYIALLFTEMYLDRYFTDVDHFCADLNRWLAENGANLPFSPYTADRLNKLAFMCATGSGKTLLMHIHILQFCYYFNRAKRTNHRLSLNKIIVLAPNEGMSRQHLEELAKSSIPASMFDKDRACIDFRRDVLVIDMNKLKEEGKVKTVSVDSFEQNNLVLIDEGHRGLSGDAWYEYRSRLSAEGFAFEYSATFKQALNPNAVGNTKKARDERALMEEYGKSILMDYSYKHFFRDGYGKDYRIYNLQSTISSEQYSLYLVGCLLSFYQQMKLFEKMSIELLRFRIEKPLLIFVGNRVITPVKAGKLSLAEAELLTDVEEVLMFLHTFLRDRAKSVDQIRIVLHADTGLVDGTHKPLFQNDFQALADLFGGSLDPAEIRSDLLRLVFHADSNADEPRLKLENLRQVPGEIGLKVGDYGDYFGVINIGDTAGLLKRCEQRGIVVDPDVFSSESLFHNIKAPKSNINMLIGSRKFIEGWDSWRVSMMGLINFAKGEGAQAIQLFGRGIRLRGYEGSLKRSRKLDAPIPCPKHIEQLETLTIFGVKAQYMEDFKYYLEQEGAPSNELVAAFRLPVVNRFDAKRGKKLYVIQVKDGANFKQQAGRLLLDPPEKDFLRYLTQSKILIDCRSKIQTVDSTVSVPYEVAEKDYTLPADLLPLLDLRRITEELQQYKSEKRYYNISISSKQLLAILQKEGWYGLLIPKNHLDVNSYAKLEAATDYAIMALKSYLDKFFKYEKAHWEASMLEYAPLKEDDRNLVQEYTVTYVRQNPADAIEEELGAFFTEASNTLRAHSSLDTFKQECLQGKMALFDVPFHLYTPLIGMEPSHLDLQVSPVALNSGETRFLELLNTYVAHHSCELKGKELYLLRNQSKTGMGFFEAGNFYPDYVLWIDTEETQYISFIDPKGLRNVRFDDPKIEFYHVIKGIETRLAPTVDDKKIVLNSFIMSSTPAILLQQYWNVEPARWEEKNVFTLDNPNCVNAMMRKILP